MSALFHRISGTNVSIWEDGMWSGKAINEVLGVRSVTNTKEP